MRTSRNKKFPNPIPKIIWTAMLIAQLVLLFVLEKMVQGGGAPREIPQNIQNTFL